MFTIIIEVKSVFLHSSFSNLLNESQSADIRANPFLSFIPTDNVLGQETWCHDTKETPRGKLKYRDRRKVKEVCSRNGR